jgi:hypothetical protein
MIGFRTNHLLLTAVVLLLLPSAVVVGQAQTMTTYFYTPDNITNISGRSYADVGAPPGQFAITIWGGTSNAVSEQITGWNLGDFTGSISPTPYGTYQRGISNAQYGCTSVQMHTNEAGVQLHTWSIPGGSGYHQNLLTGIIGYGYDATNCARPWLHNNSTFHFSYYTQIPRAYVAGGAIAYVQSYLFLHDKKTARASGSPSTCMTSAALRTVKASDLIQAPRLPIHTPIMDRGPLFAPRLLLRTHPRAPPGPTGIGTAIRSSGRNW